MKLTPSRIGTYIVGAALLVIFILHLKPLITASSSRYRYTSKAQNILNNGKERFRWNERQEHFPVKSYVSLPQPGQQRIPKVQYEFFNEDREEVATRRQRQAQVKQAMARSWNAYRHHAWLMDELAPISGGNKTTYGGWAATLVDSLDTLWIMDMKPEFSEAVDAILHIDFTATTMETINLFETTIRYMGGFLSAYDLSGDQRLLDKAMELADMIYAAFDTPNRMPILRWDFHAAAAGEKQVSPDDIILAEIGSLCLEFTRLSQITNDPKWYDAVARISKLFEEQQGKTQLPGMWPLKVNGGAGDFATGDTFSLGAFCDSMYEYLPKMFALLGGNQQYAKMHLYAMETALEAVIYRPMIKDDNRTILAAGTTRVKDGATELQPELQHLQCFIGGMFALGGRLLGNENHVSIGEQLTESCVWAYKQFPAGIMPENAQLVPCPSKEPCTFDKQAWHDGIIKDSAVFDNMGKSAETLIKELRLPEGFSTVRDGKYHLRPEAIESVFVMYRITGDKKWQEKAWDMFRSIYVHTRTQYAHAAIEDVSNSTAPLMDNMESFW